MATILSRSTWTSTAPGFPRISSRRLNPDNVVRLVPHYPAAGNVSFANPTLAQSCQRIRNWRNYHVGTNGWADLGYPYVIDQAGRIFEGAGDTHAAAHALQNNFTSIGVLFIVGNNERPSAKARAAFRALGRRLRKKFKNMSTVPRDHGRMPGNSTSCAGQPIRKDIDAGNLSFGSSGSTASSGSQKASGGSYTVKAGDTLSEIAVANGVSTSALASANGIKNRHLIRVGQRLSIPSGSKSSSSSVASKSTAVLAQEVLDNKHGNGEARKKSLGSRYDAVQAEVNRILAGRSAPKKQSAQQVANDIANGRGGWGNEPTRSRKLRAAGYNATDVQRRVNQILSSPAPRRRLSNRQVAQQIIDGKGGWGNEPQRSRRLRAQGYNPSAVQAQVNRMI